jgi:hypothetical protein
MNQVMLKFFTLILACHDFGKSSFFQPNKAAGSKSHHSVLKSSFIKTYSLRPKNNERFSIQNLSQK